MSEEGRDPRVAFLHADHAAALSVRGRGDNDELVVRHMTQAKRPRRIHELDLDLFFTRGFEAETFEPDPAPRSASGTVYHDIRVDRPILCHDAGNPRLVVRRA